VGKLTGGLILVLAVVQPLVTWDYDQLYDWVNALPAGSLSQEEVETAAWPLMKGSIEEELNAYIAEKAADQGISCAVQVTCTQEEVPVPEEVTVTGTLDNQEKETLAQLLTQTLGLDREHQHFVEEESP
jgi:stage III sporulation protein AF